MSTINGDANVPFYKELGNQGIKATDIPVVAFSVGEEELAGLDTKPLLGHLAAWNYFELIKSAGNAEFIKKWQAYTKNPKRVTNDPMEAHVIGFNMWVKAVEKVKSTDADKVIDALPGIEAANLTGGTSKMLPNHHITKPVFIGEIRGDGQFDVVWKTKGLVPGDAWSDFLPGSKDLEADWVTLKCGNYNKVTKKCGGQAVLSPASDEMRETAVMPPSPSFTRFAGAECTCVAFAIASWRSYSSSDFYSPARPQPMLGRTKTRSLGFTTDSFGDTADCHRRARGERRSAHRPTARSDQGSAPVCIRPRPRRSSSRIRPTN